MPIWVEIRPLRSYIGITFLAYFFAKICVDIWIPEFWFRTFYNLFHVCMRAEQYNLHAQHWPITNLKICCKREEEKRRAERTKWLIGLAVAAAITAERPVATAAVKTNAKTLKTQLKTLTQQKHIKFRLAPIKTSRKRSLQVQSNLQKSPQQQC